MPNAPMPRYRCLVADAATAAVRMLPDGDVIQVSPDAIARRVADLPAARIPRIGIADWIPAGDGTYRPVIRLHECLVRLTDAERVTGVPYNSLRRLLTSGFIRGVQPTPRTILIDLHSYYEHLELCKDPEFWSPQRVQRYVDENGIA